MEPIIHLEKVMKRYGSLLALNGVSLSLRPGRIGLLGPNGAGKSTLMKTLLGLVEHDEGDVRVFGEPVRRDPFSIRARIGYMPEGDSVLPELTALQYTILAAELCGMPRGEATVRAQQVLYYVGLGEARYRRLGGFSTGMKQRARLAQALVGDPTLLLLDEPTSGLDPRGRDEMLALIVDIPNRTGTSVLLSTHILPDVEKTCDQVVVMASGEVRYAGELAPLLRTDEGILDVRVKGDGAAFRQALELERCLVSGEHGKFEVRLPEGGSTRIVLEAARTTGSSLRHLAPFARRLESAFFETIAEH